MSGYFVCAQIRITEAYFQYTAKCIGSPDTKYFTPFTEALLLLSEALNKILFVIVIDTIAPSTRPRLARKFSKVFFAEKKFETGK